MTTVRERFWHEVVQDGSSLCVAAAKECVRESSFTGRRLQNALVSEIPNPENKT